MTREQIIKQAAEQFADREHGTMRDVSVFNLLQYAFKRGAEWADEHPDLSSLWHDPSEEPKSYEYKVICDGRYGTLMWDHSMLTEYSWREYTRCWAVSQWAYVNDLIPK